MRRVVRRLTGGFTQTGSEGPDRDRRQTANAGDPPVRPRGLHAQDVVRALFAFGERQGKPVFDVVLD
jgi:hypothetical protein